MPFSLHNLSHSIDFSTVNSNVSPVDNPRTLSETAKTPGDETDNDREINDSENRSSPKVASTDGNGSDCDSHNGDLRDSRSIRTNGAGDSEADRAADGNSTPSTSSNIPPKRPSNTEIDGPTHIQK